MNLTVSWIKLLHDLLGELGFMEALIQQILEMNMFFFLLLSNATTRNWLQARLTVYPRDVQLLEHS